jgi:hypothetical protein
MKAISYSIFKADCQPFEFMAYMRGLYFNARMNKLIYPEWQTMAFVSSEVLEKYYNFFVGLKMVHIFESDNNDPLCKGMLRRMEPVFLSIDPSDGFHDTITHVICRDADAITTYKEAQAVQEWIDSGLGFHGITDNPAHGLPMMGGMVGFKVDHFKQTFPEWTSFEQMIKGHDLSQRGSDQDFMMKKIYPKAKDNMMGHFFDGCREKVKITTRTVQSQIPGVDPKLWESGLTCRHIGSPGVVDLEVLRFFSRFNKSAEYDDFEKQFPEICYWRR